MGIRHRHRQSQYSVMRVLMGEADQGLQTPAEYYSLDYHEGFLSMVRSQFIRPRIHHMIEEVTRIRYGKCWLFLLNSQFPNRTRGHRDSSTQILRLERILPHLCPFMSALISTLLRKQEL